MIIKVRDPAFAFRLDALRIQCKPLEQRQRLLSLLDNRIVWEGLQSGLSRPEAYRRADSYIAAVKERIAYLDSHFEHPKGTISRLPCKSIYRRKGNY